MSLYIRLHNSFWRHRKTIKVVSLIGDDALWILPKLWCYAADNQPDGDFSSYSAQELALLIGYNKDATSMLKALQQAGFFDGMMLHDWQEWNGYHVTYHERAKVAAKQRWSDKTGHEMKGNEKKGNEKKRDKHCLKHATSNATSIETEEFAKEFDNVFWPEYPLKENKKIALRRFIDARKNKVSLDGIMAGLKRYKAVVQADWKTGFARKWKQPDSWLLNEKWLDEVTPATGKPPKEEKDYR